MIKEKTRSHENIDAPVKATETENTIKNGDEVYTTVETKPQFEGGISEFYKFIGENYVVPEIEGLNGRVLAQL